MRKSKGVICICYNKEHTFSSRKKAEAFFKDCAYNSEGAERDRYIEILMQLDEGRAICFDTPDHNPRMHID